MPKQFTDKIKAVLLLTRAHTLPLETVPAVVGAIAAGASKEAVLVWGFIGATYHLGGYSMNSVTDWLNGYDEEDEYKQHHPLNTGELDVRVAGAICLLITSVCIGAIAGMIWHTGSVASIIILLIGAACGVAYNQFGKRTEYKFILISIAHSTMFILPYMMHEGIDGTLVLGGLTVFVWVMFQISVSGEIKDITTDEENFMKKLGFTPVALLRQEGHSLKYVRGTPLVYATLLRVWVTVLCLGVLSYGTSVSQAAEHTVAFLIIVIGTVSVAKTLDLLSAGLYNREKRIGDMSLIEALTLAMFVLGFYPSLGISGPVALIGGSTAWVYALSKVMWTSRLAPEV